MTGASLRIGTRASDLALTQSGHVGAALVDGTGHEVELVHVSTRGDRDRTSPLAQIGGTGVFVTAVRQALLDGTVDVVVHSCKDLPTAPLDEITLACYPPREDPRDALCARDGLTLAQLPAGSRVGTGSPRRAAQEPWFAERLTAVDDPATRAAVTAERMLLRTLEAGCSAPVAAYAEIEAPGAATAEGEPAGGGVLRLRALAIRTDGSHVVEGEARVALDLAADALSGPESVPAALGAELAADLLSRGAGDILAEARS